MQVELINPDTLTPFPTATVGGRLCVAVSAGRRFAIRVTDSRRGGKTEVVLAVDGRDTLSNRDASPDLGGIVFSDTYLCRGFRISEHDVREFVCVELGDGMATAERRGTADSAGLIAAVAYAERGAHALGTHRSDAPRGVTRGVTRGAGTAAGATVHSPVGSMHWIRGDKLEELVIEYDTPSAWSARGIVIPQLNMASPWPGATRAFADPSLL